MRIGMSDLEIIDAALERCDLLTDEQRIDLERHAALLRSNLYSELRKAVLRDDKEVALALARQMCRGFASAEPKPHQDCFIYCRVSSDNQAINGTGLWRQMDICREYADQRDYTISAVFSEVASGDGPLPVRATVERLAKKRGCLILCEDHSRWSRRGVADIPPVNVIMTSEAEREFDEALREIFTKHRLQVIDGGLA